MPEQKTKEQLAQELKAKNEKIAADKKAADKKAAEKKAAEQKAAADKAAKAKKAAEDKAVADKAAKLKKSNDTPVLQKTKDNYVPEPGTEDMYHCKIEKVSFNAKNGKRQSKPRVQYFDPRGFRNFKVHSSGLGWTVTILHDPTGEYPVFGIAKADAEEEAKQ
jgi:hypothetical protein